MNLSMLIVGLGLSTGFALITALFRIQESRTGRKVFYLKEATIMGCLTGIFNMVLSLDYPQMVYEFLDRIVLTSWIVVFAMFGLFFSASRNEAPDWKMTVVTGGLGIISITSGFIGVLTIDAIYHNLIVFIWKSSFGMFAALIFLYGAKVFFDANSRLSESRSLTMSVLLVIIGMAYISGIFLHNVPVLLLGSPLIIGLDLEFTLDIIRIITIIGIVIALGSDSEYVYRIPIRIYDIQVNTLSGLNLYQFGGWDDSTDPNLFAGALTAISLVMKEAANSESSLKRIETGDRCIMIESRSEHEVVFTAIVERPSLFLNRSLKNFADMFIERYNEQLMDESVFAGFDFDASFLVYIAFPYLKVKRDTTK